MTAVAEIPSDPDAPSVQQQLYAEGASFDFFQAVRLLEQSSAGADRDRRLGSPAVRFSTPPSTAFPASAIDSITPDDADENTSRVRVNFMGLTGPSGVLPRHYTELLIQLECRLRDAAKRTLNAWYDLFNNRLIGQLYRVWAKCRIDRGLADGVADRTQADPFSTALYSLIGVATPKLRNRLSVTQPTGQGGAAEVVDQIPDSVLARHVGTLSRRRRSASQVAAMLSSHFRVPVEIEQFQGQWLQLSPAEQTRAGAWGAANRLGVDAVLGSRVWDRQSRIRVRVGPLDAQQFARFLPDAGGGQDRRRFVSLCQMVRLAIGPELDFDVQLVLRKSDIPRLSAQRDGDRPRLGWSSWLAAAPLERDGGEPVFEPIESSEA
ncbi:hypothetical protein KOR34_14460 [Posidoniimonas corsicana]|uniref:Type VI secretion protein, VC_A0111 family n=1 Tax=Posidoniimonas corsicana TaxID=1938618 RepID=A0A5C5VFA6_9BACT|nr:type VI secretion system baseplate subunit TssG [Posidoniimonas corsicana]TWT36540.1 hypothetical protein KOR34_14460 [Posidoniimonas corsicana]